jgi:hypothetical protein
VEEAGPRAVEAYLAAYGPATRTHLNYWLGSGLGAGKRIGAWVNGLGDRLAEVDIEGTSTLLIRADLEQLEAASPTAAVRLLPAYDQWVLGPSTADPNIVPPARRAVVTRGAPIVVVGGVVSGTWSLRGDEVGLDWFAASGSLPTDQIAAEVSRLARIVGRPLTLAAATV